MFAGFTIKRTATEPVAAAKAVGTRVALRKYRNLGIAGVLLLVTIFFPWTLKIRADFTILPNEVRVVRSQTEGTVREIMVSEDDHVNEGELIAVLYDFGNERNLSLIDGELAQKRAELDLLEKGPRDEEVDRAERLVDTKRQELNNVRRNLQQRNQLEQSLTREQTELLLADIEFRRTRDLFEEGLGPRIDMEKAETELEIQRSTVAETEASLDILTESNDREEDLKERELAEAESALALLMAGFRSEEIEQSRAAVQMLESQHQILTDEIEKNRIEAPISGTVVTPFVERLLNRHLLPGEEVVRLVDVDRVWAELLVPEKEMADVYPGSLVVLKVRSYPAIDYEGEVDFIAPVAETVNGELFVKVRTVIRRTRTGFREEWKEMSNEDGALKEEMTGVAKIYDADSRPIIRVMTRGLVRLIRTEFWHLLP